MRLVSACGKFEAWVEIDGKEQEIYDSKPITGHDPRSQAYLVSPPDTVSPNCSKRHDHSLKLQCIGIYGTHRCQKIFRIKLLYR